MERWSEYFPQPALLTHLHTCLCILLTAFSMLDAVEHVPVGYFYSPLLETPSKRSLFRLYRLLTFGECCPWCYLEHHNGSAPIVLREHRLISHSPPLSRHGFGEYKAKLQRGELCFCLALSRVLLNGTTAQPLSVRKHVAKSGVNAHQTRHTCEFCAFLVLFLSLVDLEMCIIYVSNTLWHHVASTTRAHQPPLRVQYCSSPGKRSLNARWDRSRCVSLACIG